MARSKIHVRPFQPGNDFAWLFEFLSQLDAPAVRQWAGNTVRHPVTREGLEYHLRKLNVKIPVRRSFVAVPTGTSSTGAAQQPVGYVELFNIQERGSAFITRMIVDPEERGQGFGTALVRSVLAIGFETHRLHRIELNVYDFNTAAIRCYEKAGFQKEGLMRGITFTGREYWNAYRMAILEDEWRRSR